MITANDEYKKIVSGIAAIYKDHGDRAITFLRHRGQLPVSADRAPSNLLLSIGSWLALEEWVKTGAMKVVAPQFPHGSKFCHLQAMVLASLLQTAPNVQTHVSGTTPWRVACLRFAHENWWDTAGYIRGEPLARMVARVELNDEGVTALANLLWAKRNAIRN